MDMISLEPQWDSQVSHLYIGGKRLTHNLHSHYNWHPLQLQQFAVKEIKEKIRSVRTTVRPLIKATLQICDPLLVGRYTTVEDTII